MHEQEERSPRQQQEAHHREAEVEAREDFDVKPKNPRPRDALQCIMQ